MSEVRLIDANALKDAHIECPENVSFFVFGEIVERFLQTIDEQPTVDAVPVEWIESYVRDASATGDFEDEMSAVAIEAMLNDYRAAWRKAVGMNENEDLKRVAQQTILHAMEQVTDEIEYVADNAVADSEKRIFVLSKSMEKLTEAFMNLERR